MKRGNQSISNFFHVLRSSVDEMTPAVISSYTLGGECLEIRYQTHDDWNRYHPAIQHLQVRAPDCSEVEKLQILVTTAGEDWENSLPQEVRRAFETADAERASQFLFRDENISVCIQYGDAIECIQCYSKQEKKAYFFVDKSSQNELLTAPFRTLFAWLLEDNRKLLLHAAAFSDAEKGFLVAGRSGVGKTNFSLYAHAAGYTFLGDDTICCALQTPVTIYSLYNTVRVHEVDTMNFSALFHAPRHRRDAKWYAHINASIHPGGQVLKAILLPTADMSACICEPVSAFETLKAIAPSSLLHVPGYEGAASLIRTLVETAPAFRVKQPSSVEDVHVILQSLDVMNG